MNQNSTDNSKNVKAQLNKDCAEVINLDKFRCDQENYPNRRKPANTKHECKVLRVFNGCEVRVENSVPRVTVSVSRSLSNDAEHLSPSDGIFNTHRTTIIDSFACILFIRLSCVPTSKVSVPHFARLAVIVDRFLWDYNGKPLFKDRHRQKMDQ